VGRALPRASNSALLLVLLYFSIQPTSTTDSTCGERDCWKFLRNSYVVAANKQRVIVVWHHETGMERSSASLSIPMEADNYNSSRDSHDRIHVIHGPSTATCHGLDVFPTSATSLDPGVYIPFGAVAFRWWYWSCTMAPTGLSSQQPLGLPLIIIRLLVIPVGKQPQAALIQSSRSDDGMAAPAT
jgi:hypothetical protein